MNVTRGTTVIEFTSNEAALLLLLAGKTGGPYREGKTLECTCESVEQADRIRHELLDKLYEALKGSTA